MASQGRIPVLLTTQSDWDEWLEIVRTTAMRYKVWELIDPAREEVITLREPVRPTPADVRPPTRTVQTTISVLTEDEKEEYRSLIRDYEHNLKIFEKRTNGLGILREKIQESVARPNLVYTFNCDTVREMLQKLLKRLSPTNASREQELILRYTHFRTNTPNEKGIDGWLAGFEKVYTDCTIAKLPDVEGTRPIRDFLIHVRTFEPGFSDYWQNRISDKGVEGMDFYEILQKFREFRADNIRVVEHNAVFATQGVGRGLCLCGKDHRFKDCPYLNAQVRDRDWNADPVIQMQISKKLAASEKLRTAVSVATGQCLDNDEPPTSF